MPAPTRGVAITLDRERHLRFPLGVLRDIQGDDADMVTILHTGLKHEDPELTVEQVGEMIDLEMLPELTEPLKKATGGMIDLGRLLDADEDAEGKPLNP
ncbi:MAG TPA: hypothetical protein VK966_05220 [Longimicrobiales bacterium]|nr:hypothetical protein [Longimicrobiales bacterium]